MGGMLRRWVIRVPILLGLGCVLSVWVASYLGAVEMSWQSENFWDIGGVQGLCVVSKSQVIFPGTSPPHIDFAERVTVEGRFGAHGPPRMTFGLYCGKGPGLADSYLVIFPLWLPAIVLAGLNWFVWRKTRDKGVGRAFPVEGTGKDDGSRPSCPVRARHIHSGWGSDPEACSLGWRVYGDFGALRWARCFDVVPPIAIRRLVTFFAAFGRRGERMGRIGEMLGMKTNGFSGRVFGRLHKFADSVDDGDDLVVVFARVCGFSSASLEASSWWVEEKLAEFDKGADDEEAGINGDWSYVRTVAAIMAPCSVKA